MGYDLTKFEFTDFQKNTFIALSIFHVLFEKARDIFYKIECLIYLVNFIFDRNVSSYLDESYYLLKDKEKYFFAYLSLKKK